ncbi:MAG: hypothetical protein COZ75_05575 [Flavobacteriaceae bacterium CG_4_8_14_3_um_filter_34_10]|nr:hypothetical protein [Flavobacteriia bacterium]OIP50488.1 MAG: hypothetical protein AUK33_07250 [Flavobacteriaceae bacterium CG2_30_34_30]PIQ17532.1 MAG: hypothetical protein COW66_11325 [Flavobacteriaceae bacterium CG18_big_fil_WC_8_21_14_2_50_34_36]PIV48430.1 MAG: hypothetical protein COS19_13795 [Flavobacteriaceae bacterium CG02_land_8_20_14_3_00_34_13]PIX09669.1 MAG: hypothetical protein COZ75_05575 [Flavobacteriaceae bacterium CG_4_8_14_3_um_filter_34_10]PIZ08173.1 MAG: hypothetical pr
MKLLVITAIKEFKKTVIQTLKEANVENFSYRNVTGYKDLTEHSVEDNWFAGEMNETESVLFFAFVKKDLVNPLFAIITAFNVKQKTASKIHVAVLSIEKAIG